jgi:hypothetical protein
MTEQTGFSEQRQQFINHLQNVVGITKSNQTEIIVVGGIALRSAMGKPVEFQRSNGTIPDIDIIGLGPNPENIQKSIKEINQYRKSNPTCPSVGLEPIRFSDKPNNRYSLIEMLSGIRKNSQGNYFLTLRSVDQPVNVLTMSQITRNYGGVDIPTLPQETILYRYLVRMGYFKPKDINKIQEFRQHLNNTGGDFLDPKLYLPYIEFCQRVQEKHPVVIGITQTYWKFDKAIGGKISGSSGFFYDLIKPFRR